MVTFAPTFNSPLTLVCGSRSISHRSAPFWRTIFVGVVSSTVPVTSCVFAPAAKVALQKIKFAIAIKLNAIFVFMDEQRPRTVPAQAFWPICEYWGIEVRAIDPNRPSQGDAGAKERRFSTTA